ncbi:hypothetical protein [Actinacidiphila acididurans]|uniref:Uncharacterized protein n=1 Tax=Actinacidiphila acididurans TaxID=2784346 RepID=A0ABS2TIF9_9ACTN|nr:hypothetical protein [Actinacidiphila acididurans]MBM9503134.1 hypothetical protein [Actinacidiphila acididurans]
MTTQPETDNSEYFLIPRDPEGQFIATAERIVQERGIPEFTQSLRADVTAPLAAEQVMLLELQNLLPARVNIESGSPFLTLRVSASPADSRLMSRCQCKCGGNGWTCGGGGGGGA